MSRKGLCQGGGGSMSRRWGSVKEGSLQGVGVSVQWASVQEGSLSRRGLYPGGSCSGRCLSRRGLCSGRSLSRDIPPDRHPLSSQGTWDQRQRTPRRSMGPGSQTGSDIIETPSSLWTEWLTHTCENITLPQTSFAGGNNGEIDLKSSTQSQIWFLVRDVCTFWPKVYMLGLEGLTQMQCNVVAV